MLAPSSPDPIRGGKSRIGSGKEYLSLRKLPRTLQEILGKKKSRNVRKNGNESGKKGVSSQQWTKINLARKGVTRH